jgi:hypothetical protein
MKNYKFSLYNLVIAVVILVWGLSDPQYDDGSYGSLYFFVLPFFAFIFVGSGELLNQISSEILPTIHMVLTFVIGMLFTLAIDVLFRSIKQRMNHGK